MLTTPTLEFRTSIDDERAPLLGSAQVDVEVDARSVSSAVSLQEPIIEVIRKPVTQHSAWSLDNFEGAMYWLIGIVGIWVMDVFVWFENGIYGGFRRLVPGRWKARDY